MLLKFKIPRFYLYKYRIVGYLYLYVIIISKYYKSKFLSDGETLACRKNHVNFNNIN